MILLAGCTAEAPTEFDPNEEATLTVWSWDPATQIVADVYEEAHPHITVKVVNVGVEDDEYTKLRAAHASGSGAPDVAMITTHVSQFVLEGIAEDLTPYGLDEVIDEYEPWAIELQRVDADHTYALPLDAGVMGLMYREDLLAAAGVKTPTTWQEFADAARQVRAADSDSYLASFPAGQWAWFQTMLWNGGSKPFHIDGTTISIDIDNDEAISVAKYWDQLLSEDLVKVEAPFTAEWVGAMDNGTYWGWLAPSWGPVLLEDATGSQGDWRIAPLPSWGDGGDPQPLWASGAYMITADGAQKALAADFVKFVTQDPEAISALQTGSPYPFFPVKSVVDSEEWLNKELPFYGDQKANQVFAEISDGVAPEGQYSPFDDFVHLQGNQLVGDALNNGTSLVDAIIELQARVVTHAEQEGFTVK
ncbi:ABC transporter substrate-binding protein [Microbacterium sp.]|uniref:ABC transporter substrate-binding protein n=1 Tax=Microbacterium sp. TaxID=51671 RepID=UPI003F99A921